MTSSLLLRIPSLAALMLLIGYMASPAQVVPGGNSSGLVNRPVDAGTDLRASVATFDKCGPISEKGEIVYASILAAGLGYYYADLLEDIETWKESPFVVETRSIGRSVEDRDIWELTITDTIGPRWERHRVTIHARTHPHEIQSWWVVENIIEFLLSDDPYAQLLRESCIFHIYPMYNPDGVEANSTRYNANGIDLEREWDKKEPQPEAAALKARFDEFMGSGQPIEVALNLHSSSDPERYFWFHDPTGTSEEYADLQREFVGEVRSVFDRIMPWDYAVSWNGIAPTHFPESWFWYNFGTDVLALTYEDVFSHNLETPGADFDSAAIALLHGVGEYLDAEPASIADDPSTGSDLTATVDPSGVIHLWTNAPGKIRLRLYDRLGRLTGDFGEKSWHAGTHQLPIGQRLPAGVYYLYGSGTDRQWAIPLIIQ